MDRVELIREATESTQSGDTEGFVDSYRTFTTVLNRLRRQYLNLKDESQRQAKALEEANESLQALTRRNHAAMEFLNSILGSVSTGIIVVDRERNITHLNPAAEELFSVKVTEALGLSLDAVAKFDCSTVLAESGRKQSRVKESSPVSQLRGVEKVFVAPDGEEKTYLWGSSQLLDKKGESFGSVEAFQDITGIKLMERKMTRMESLAAIGEMAATVAHQVRNPLVGVKGFASLIRAQPAKGSKNKAHAEMILRGVGNLERVIDALLRFSSTESLTLRPTNLNRYLKKVVRQYNERQYDEWQYNKSKDDQQQCQDTLGSDSRSDSTVTISACEDRITVDLDQLVFREAVVNIIRNAHEAAEGPITCNLIIENHTSSAKFAYVEIRDDGPGMAPEIARDIFRPFFTTKASGSGLGLPLARKLINAHGGEITVDSTLGVGTAFRIKLPLSTGENTNPVERSNDNLEQEL